MWKSVEFARPIMDGIEQGLKQRNATYRLNAISCTTMTVAAGSNNYNKDGLFKNQNPKLLIIGQVSSQAFVGDWESNPFNFQHFNIEQCQLWRDGREVPIKSRPMNFATGEITHAYMQFLISLGQANFYKKDTGITMKDYAGGNALFAFNLAPDQGLTGHAQPMRDSNITLTMQWRQPLRDSINIIVYAIFDSKVQLTNERHSIVDLVG